MPIPKEPQLKTITIFYQREGVAGADALEFHPGALVSDLRTALVAKHGVAGDTLIFFEDEEEPAEPERALEGKSGTVKVHAHRCRHVEVEVTFNSRTVKRKFAPAATIARVKRWAAETEFKMTPEEAGEHVLQLAGSEDRPGPGVHVGTLVTHPTCRVLFDLVPNERINGFAARLA
jgi:hypothetical protein